MAEHQELVFTLNDDSEVESSFVGPYSIAEQIAFEEHFRCSFVVIEQAVAAMHRQALAASYRITCETCSPPVGAFAPSEEQASVLRKEHLNEHVDHEVEISAPEDTGATVDPTDAFRVTWIMWFGWHRARAQGKVAGKFSVFLQQVKDWRFETPEPEADPDPAADPPALVELEEEKAVEVGSLDPTPQDPPVIS